MQDKQIEVCVMNTESAAVCHFSTFVGIIGFLAAIGFLVGEWYELALKTNSVNIEGCNPPVP